MPARAARRRAPFVLAVAVVAVASCRVSASIGDGASPAPSIGSSAATDTAEARRVFEANIGAIHRRDRAAYLSLYLNAPTLARTGPGGMELGFDDWPARRDTTWPDTLVARNLRLVPVAPGVVYGTYQYRVSQGGETSEGIS